MHLSGRYGIVEFNVPLDTLSVISETILKSLKDYG